VDKPFNSPDDSIVYTYSFGIKLSLWNFLNSIWDSHYLPVHYSF
jgi:hypothetical protein